MPFGPRGRRERAAMKIVVIGGSGLTGQKAVTNLRQHGHEVVAASPSSGVNTVTDDGLAQALGRAEGQGDRRQEDGSGKAGDGHAGTSHRGTRPLERPATAARPGAEPP